MSSSEDEFCSDIENGALEASKAVIPEKSKALYEAAYNQFILWCKSKETDSVCEKVLKAYFNEKSKTIKGTTLWCIYSKLKSMIFLKHNIDISKYVCLLAFLKRKNIGLKTKQSNILNRDQFEKFIIEADDQEHLLLKVAFIIGIGGACRKIELLKLTTDKVVDNGDYMSVDIVDTKTYEPRQFIVTPGSINGMDLLALLRRYVALRPSKQSTDRFFVGYRSGKCVAQPVGTNTFASMPSKIAAFLGLNDVAGFTGHCFRRSSATILAEAGASLTTIKRIGGWKSASVAERYIQNTMTNKRKAAHTIFGKDAPSTSKQCHKNAFMNGGNSSDAAAEISNDNITNEGSSVDFDFLEGDIDIIFQNNPYATVQTYTSSQVTSSREMSMSVVVTPKAETVPPTPTASNDFAPKTIAPIAVPSTSVAPSERIAPIAVPPNAVASNGFAPNAISLNTNPLMNLPNVPANISGSTFHGCSFYFYPKEQ